MAFFPFPIPAEAVQAATKLLWDKRSMLPENSEELVRDVLEAALPFLRMSPGGDNHHNAAACPYCTPSAFAQSPGQEDVRV